jgi:uncharacterized Zn finger protein (UPF0148 family)
MGYKCPRCGSVIYSRRNVLCGVCGERLPADLLFSASERERVERDLSELKKREQAAKAADEAAAQESSLRADERVSRHYPLFGSIIRALTRKRW